MQRSSTRASSKSFAVRFPKSSSVSPDALKLPAKLARQSLACDTARGKSGLHRAGCWVTPRRREATNRATETSRDARSKDHALRVKRGNLHPEQHQIGGH